MCHNILAEEEANREVHKRETCLMLGESSEESSHASCGRPRHFQKDGRHIKIDKDASNDVEPRNICKEKDTSVVTTSEEELLFILFGLYPS